MHTTNIPLWNVMTVVMFIILCTSMYDIRRACIQEHTKIKPTLQLLCVESKKVQSTHNKVFTCIMHKDSK